VSHSTPDYVPEVCFGTAKSQYHFDTFEQGRAQLNALDLARWQFAITTVYHFLFVPITIGSGFLVAGLQTAWYRTNKDKYLRATKFFGKLFLINFAIGVVTGIVQEFQFGMNWSSYSRFVGDIFGAPLAMEGLLAFFLESTFLGLWIFGWDRLSRKMHVATIWMAAFGTLFSAYFILAANAFMQHPTGYVYNATTGRAELTNIVKVLTQNTAVAAFLHTVPSAFMTAGGLFAGVAGWMMVKKRDVEVAKPVLKLGLVTLIVAFVIVAFTGDWTARIMTTQQPMKMAAAEAAYNTQSNMPFSLFTIGTLDGSKPVFQIGLPSMLSFMSTGNFNGVVEGVNDLQKKYEQQYGPGNYKPNIPLAYWGFRLMIGFGAIAALFAVVFLWRMRKGKFPDGKWSLRALISMPFLPLVAIIFGWLFTETARQPWIVFGLLKTKDGVSASVGAGSVLFTMIAFTLLYGFLAVIEVGLMMRTIKVGTEAVTSKKSDDSSDSLLTMAY
jgi:cytochrome d ubiquinol oxidase subunit I